MVMAMRIHKRRSAMQEADSDPVAGEGGGALADHEARAVILSELHARPFLPVQAPRRVYHFAFATDHEEAHADRLALAALAEANGATLDSSDAKFHSLAFGGWELRWEQHTEFTTYTWSASTSAEKPFAHPDPLAAGELAFRAPGRLVVATHLSLIEGGEPLDALAKLFNPQSLCIVGAAKGAAHILTDFSLDAHGFTRLLVRANATTALEAGRLVQRVLEIETYRTMALLGLPEARRAGPELGRMEHEIAEINQALSQQGNDRTSRDLLKRLSDLLAASEALSTRTAFRFGASRAYHAIVKNRLGLIRETKESPYTTISAFFSARLDPAIETCNALETRLARLSSQVARAIDLMRTGITLELEQQNRDLLQDMNRRARLQMRLQGIVQGISIAALAYYLSGLTVYLAKGLKDAGWLPEHMTADEIAALALPFTIFASWAFMERVRRLSTKAKEEEQVS
jgi:uncharacterized membrane-anchored protein